MEGVLFHKEPSSHDIERISRTRSDSNSIIIDNDEFESDILEMLNNDEHAFVLFDSLYNDFKMNRISATSFFLQLESIAGTSIARSIFELVKLNCPIELYPEVEHFLDSTADDSELEERIQYERNICEQYDYLITQLKQICHTCSDNQKGLSKDHSLFRSLQRIKRNSKRLIHTIHQVMNEEECGYTVNRIDEYNAALEMLTIQLQDKLKATEYLEDDYDPLLDDDSVNEMFKENHRWIVRTIKNDSFGSLKRKRFVLFPRSQRSIDVHCREDEFFMIYWKEDDCSRLLYDCSFIPDGRDATLDVVSLLVRVSEYCFLFHSSKSGVLVQRWNNKLSFRKKKHIYSYIRHYNAEEGKQRFAEYDSKQYEVLDIRNRFLTKFDIEGGQLTVKATTTVQKEDGLHYVCTCYWNSPSMKAHVSWEVSHTWEEWKDFYQFLQYQFYYKLDQLPSFPKSHVLLTTLLTEDRILCLNRFIQGLLKDSQIMNYYEVNKFFKISSHIRKEKCHVLCMMQKMNTNNTISENIVEEPEVHLSISPKDQILKDPLSYLTSA